MTLHSTSEFLKKAGIASSIGLGGIIVIVIFFRIGVVVKNILFPPKIEPANQAYGKIPYLEFPQSTVDGDFTYTVDTLTGTLPDFPDRINVYPIVNNPPNLLNLDTVKKKIVAMRMIDTTGNPLPEIPRGGPMYEWDETTGLERKVIFDIVSLNFTLTSEYLSSNTVLRALKFRELREEEAAVPTVQAFLEGITSYPEDIDLEKTRNPEPGINYVTKPQMFTIRGSELVPATSLSSAQVIRVDLYQKNIAYEMDAGKVGDTTKFQKFKMDMPILYPKPPYSTMNFLVASGNNAVEIVSAIYSHKDINLEPETLGTYPIKTAEEALTELQGGNGYIAAYNGTDEQILINNVYLAYYMGESAQDYVMPIIVFEGPNGFFAYVNAVKNEALE